MPEIKRIRKRVTVIDACDLQDQITVCKRITGTSAGASFRPVYSLQKLYDAWALFDDRGIGINYFDKVNNEQAGITAYFYIRYNGTIPDKTAVVQYNNENYSVVKSVLLDGQRGKFVRLDCKVLGGSDKQGGIV